MDFAKPKVAIEHPAEMFYNGFKVIKGRGKPMIPIVLQNEDNIIIDSAKANTKLQVVEILVKWLAEYHFLHRDKITFYRLSEDN